MPIRKEKSAASKRAARFVLGSERFGKISAVEGIKQTPAMKKRSASFDKAGLSAAERRREIIKVYSKG